MFLLFLSNSFISTLTSFLSLMFLSYTQYLPYLHRNICSGWSNRDEVRGICGGEYTQALSTDVVVDSYSASGIPALMLLFPAIR